MRRESCVADADLTNILLLVTLVGIGTGQLFVWPFIPKVGLRDLVSDEPGKRSAKIQEKDVRERAVVV